MADDISKSSNQRSPLTTNYLRSEKINVNDNNEEPFYNASNRFTNQSYFNKNLDIVYENPNLNIQNGTEKKDYSSRRTYFEDKAAKQALSDSVRREAYGKDKPQIFNNLIIYVNGYTNPDRSTLHDMVVLHGGHFSHYLTAKSKVTHIVAENLSLKKRIEFASYKVVLPKWLVSSVQAGKLLPWQEFSLLRTNTIGQTTLDINRLKKQPQITNCNDPDFIQNFFANSRLHHLSTWKMELRQQFLDSFNPVMIPKTGEQLTIFHVDFDCFFATVAALSSTTIKCDLNKEPIVVCHGSKSSDIASCNYIARQYGIKNGMWVSQAQKLCPKGVKLVCLPYEFDKIKEKSSIFYKTLQNLNMFNMILPISIDEAVCILIRTSLNNHNDELICERIREAVFRDTEGCTVSVGCADTLILARLSLKLAKPNGYFTCMKYMKDSPLFWENFKNDDLPGIGRQLVSKLNTYYPRCNNLWQLRNDASIESLKALLGNKLGSKVYNQLRGKDDDEAAKLIHDPISTFERKSLSIDINWGIRFSKIEQVDTYLERCVEYLIAKLKEMKKNTSQVTLKVMKRAKDAPIEPAKYLGMGQCDSFSRTNRLGIPSSLQGLITTELRNMFRSLSCPPAEVRGIAVHFTKLVDVAKYRQKRLPFQKNIILNINETNKINSPVTPFKDVVPDINVTTPNRDNGGNLQTGIPKRPVKRVLFREEHNNISHKSSPDEYHSDLESPRKKMQKMLDRTESSVSKRPSIVNSPLREIDTRYSPSKEESSFLSDFPTRTAKEDIAYDTTQNSGEEYGNGGSFNNNVANVNIEKNIYEHNNKRLLGLSNGDSIRDKIESDELSSQDTGGLTENDPKIFTYGGLVNHDDESNFKIMFQGISGTEEIMDSYENWIYSTLHDIPPSDRDLIILEDFIWSLLRTGSIHTVIRMTQRLSSILRNFSLINKKNYNGNQKWEVVLIRKLIHILNMHSNWDDEKLPTDFPIKY
ncbi:hypothetical protein TBLA_0A04520 [Henningerozyma blattae CBS 6284]|uniref:DNA repair protein REV1 n=1 Tax=Henningerozyma blattae (strain ATCC 34711 / CBS 6284 / DSM 70876 / NBRC 10599 / NRRL Y-10934 / UCD 77-7) TaxID=1071380 RepID=I2GVU4_HENB6|nr:hypothetical protein TBLA_0A04520 [Tetrapisispora blattae CBS 6284]CCH58246.1 hypothetical protein TBLA_0A04520 [Tetrapisispora blattae CBS 6284]